LEAWINADLIINRRLAQRR